MLNLVVLFKKGLKSDGEIGAGENGGDENGGDANGGETGGGETGGGGGGGGHLPVDHHFGDLPGATDGGGGRPRRRRAAVGVSFFCVFLSVRNIRHLGMRVFSWIKIKFTS